MNEIIIMLVFSVGLVCATGPKAFEKNDVAEQIIAMERAAFDRWTKGDPSGFLEINAPEVTYFDPLLEKRLNGLEELKALYEPIRGKIYVDRYELLNPHVQLHGDTAVLTFNYVSWIGEKESRWNCTEVYKRFAEGWRIIHTHWSMTKPELK